MLHVSCCTFVLRLEKPMLQCNFCSAAFRKLQRTSVFACGMLQGWGLEGWGIPSDTKSLLTKNYSEIILFGKITNLYRPQIGPPARNGRKMDFGPTGKKGKKDGRKIGKLAKKSMVYPFLGQFSHFSAIFSPFPWWGRNPFSAIFLHFGPPARNRKKTGDRDHKSKRRSKIF